MRSKFLKVSTILQFVEFVEGFQHRDRRRPGAFKGQAWRIGLMGASSTQANVTLVLSALERLLIEHGHTVERGAALAAAAAALRENNGSVVASLR